MYKMEGEGNGKLLLQMYIFKKITLHQLHITSTRNARSLWIWPLFYCHINEKYTVHRNMTSLQLCRKNEKNIVSMNLTSPLVYHRYYRLWQKHTIARDVSLTRRCPNLRLGLNVGLSLGKSKTSILSAAKSVKIQLATFHVIPQHTHIVC